MMESMSRPPQIIESEFHDPQMMESRFTLPQMMESEFQLPQMMESRFELPQVMESRFQALQMVESERDAPQMIDSELPQMMERALPRTRGTETPESPGRFGIIAAAIPLDGVGWSQIVTCDRTLDLLETNETAAMALRLPAPSVNNPTCGRKLLVS